MILVSRQVNETMTCGFHMLIKLPNYLCNIDIIVLLMKKLNFKVLGKKLLTPRKLMKMDLVLVQLVCVIIYILHIE